MILSYNLIVDRKDHVQYLTVSKNYSDDCICSLSEQNIALNDLYQGPMILYIAQYGQRRDKICLRVFRQSEIQTSLLSKRDKLES